jgi:hypothetical protein
MGLSPAADNAAQFEHRFNPHRFNPHRFNPGSGAACLS